MLLQRVIKQVGERDLGDLCRKIIVWTCAGLQPVKSQFNRIRTVVYFKNSRIAIGSGVILKGLSYNVKIGVNCNIYDNCIFEMIGTNALVNIGDHCIFSYGVVVSCRQKISIGNHVMIGEYCSVRDTTHDYNGTARTMMDSEDISAPITIGNDVWIGRGSLIMGGAVIEDGVVVAAHSVVKGRLERQAIYGGTPARFIKRRADTTGLH